MSTEHCPWCGNEITHEQFVRIERQIRDEEKKKLAAAKEEMRNSIEKEVAAKYSMKEQKLLADQQKLARQQQSIDSERAKIAKERQSWAATTKQQVEAAKQAAEKEYKKDFAAIRDALQKDKNDALVKKDAEFARQREGMQKKILELQQRVEQKTAGELGDGAEIDVFEVLKAAFSGDRITRIQKGKAGADILHEVQYKGEPCGSIIIDSKNRQQWKKEFVTKLRQDQTDGGAEHAILSSTVFPQGRKQLCIESGVIVASPTLVLVIVDMLRKWLISMHVAKLGTAERATKLTRLYDFMTSSEFKQKLAEAEALTGDALQIEIDEQQTHANVWKKRGTVLMRIKHVLRDIDTDICAIVEARDVTPIAAMTVRTLEH